MEKFIRILEFNYLLEVFTKAFEAYAGTIHQMIIFAQHTGL